MSKSQVCQMHALTLKCCMSSILYGFRSRQVSACCVGSRGLRSNNQSRGHLQEECTFLRIWITKLWRLVFHRVLMLAVAAGRISVPYRHIFV